MDKTVTDIKSLQKPLKEHRDERPGLSAVNIRLKRFLEADDDLGVATGAGQRATPCPVRPGTMKMWTDKEKFKDHVLEWANKLDIQVHSLAVRPMRKKWASCSTAGNLNFNAQLLTLDQENRYLCHRA
jgi:hypothetical protein